MVVSTTALAEDSLDSVKVDPTHHEVLFENAQVRVVRWQVAVGDTTLYHSHPDSLNICMTDYNGRVTGPGAKIFDVQAEAGSVAWRQGGNHAVANIGNHPMKGIIVEPKQPASSRPTGSDDPVTTDPEHYRVEFENEHIRVLRERREPGNFPMHGHPDAVQVLLTDLTVRVTTVDGETQSVTGKGGEVRWRSAAEHKGVVLGEKPVEQILVEMKGKSRNRAAVG